MLECYLYNSQVVHDSRLMLSPFHIQNNKVEIKDGSVNIVCHFTNNLYSLLRQILHGKFHKRVHSDEKQLQGIVIILIS